MSSETGQAAGRSRLNLKDVKEAPTAADESVGMELRAIRLARGESVAQVSQVLRIRKDLVEAIEHSRHDLLPGQAYAIGFVRSYADYLRLDTADVVRRYKAELGAQTAAHVGYAIPVPEDEQRFSIVSILVILVCIAGALGLAWYGAREAGWLGARPLGPDAPVAAEDPGTTPQPETLEPAPSSTPAVAAPAAPPVTAPPPPVPETPPPPPPRPGGIVAPAPGEVATAITGRDMGRSNTDARIVFIARREGFITITGPESRQPYINRNLAAGDAYRVPNRRNLTMQLSDAGAMDVLLDGAFIGRAGADGAVVKDFALSPEAYGAPAEAPAPATPPASTEPAPTPATPAPITPEPAPATPPAAQPATPPAGGTP